MQAKTQSAWRCSHKRAHDGEHSNEEGVSQTVYRDMEHKLDALFEQVEQGQEVILERANERRFKLILVNNATRRSVFDCVKHDIKLLEGFDGSLDDFKEDRMIGAHHARHV